MFEPGDVVLLDFPGVTGVKRRPTVILSSETYHKNRPDLIVGLITSQIGELSERDWNAVRACVKMALADLK